MTIGVDDALESLRTAQLCLASTINTLGPVAGDTYATAVSWSDLRRLLDAQLKIAHCVERSEGKAGYIGHGNKMLPSFRPGYNVTSIDDIETSLTRMYEELHRSYHGIAHIRRMLDMFTTYEKHLVNGQAVYWAIWFHDAVYDPKSSTNEEDSAKLAEDWLTKIGASPRVIQLATSYILATKKHELPAYSTDEDCAWFLDFDLATLGAPTYNYGVYQRQIRLEYSFVPDMEYKTGRVKVLEYFMARSNANTLFHTATFKKKYGKRAAINLSQELRAWSKYQAYGMER